MLGTNILDKAINVIYKGREQIEIGGALMRMTLPNSAIN